MLINPNFPPNFEAIDARFGITKHKYTPIFAFAPAIHNPFNVLIPPELIEHERVHIMRQGEHPEKWWDRYLAEDNFRLAEEVFSHIAELENLLYRSQNTRNDRRRISNYIIKRLCWPGYDYKPPLSTGRAEGILRWALKEKAKWGDPAFWSTVDKAGKIQAPATGGTRA